jgi:hypothetical protein
MATWNEDQLKEYVLSQSSPHPSEYDVRPYYSKVGDFVSYCWSPGRRFFTRRVDEFLTTYHDVESKAVVGCKIKGIGYLIEQVKNTLAVGQTKLKLKSISIIARGLSEEPAEKAEYQDVWDNGDVEIEDPNLQPA